MNTVSRFVIPNPKFCIINVRTCFASPYDMNWPLPTRAHMQKKSYNTPILLTNTSVHTARVDQLVNAVVLGAGCWRVAGSNPTLAIFVENAMEQEL